MKKISKLISGILACSIVTIPLLHAEPVSGETIDSNKNVQKTTQKFNEKVLSKEEQSRYDQRLKEIDSYLLELNKRQNKVKKIDKELRNSRANLSVDQLNNKVIELETNKSALKDWSENSEKYAGLIPATKLENDSSIMLATNNGSVDIHNNIYRDAVFSKHWVAVGNFLWLNTSWQNDVSGTGNVGGLDGFATGIDENIDVYDYDLSIFDSYYENNVTNQTPIYNQSNTNVGWGWEWQDKVSYVGGGSTSKMYNSASGMSRLYFEFEGGTGVGDTVEVSNKYGHTWSSTGLNGITITLGGIEFNFSSSANQWTDAISKPFRLN